MKVCSFQQKYLDDLLQCWNQALQYDPLTADRFIDQVLLDENFDADLLKIAVIEKRCVGFVYAIKRKFPYLERGLEPERGWIVAMGVLPACQRQGIGTALLEAAEQALSQRGCTNITLSAYSPSYFFPGIDQRYQSGLAFFQKMGYPFNSEAVSMQRSLWDYTLPESTVEKLSLLQQQGIRIIPYERKYMLALLDYLLKNFGAGWKRNALLAMQKKEAEDTILLCVNEKDEIIGYCMRKIDGNDARFGPIGVNEALRSHGLGGVLLDCMMLEMKSRGINYLYFLWTGGPAMRFYERHGFQIYRTYTLSRKDLTA